MQLAALPAAIAIIAVSAAGQLSIRVPFALGQDRLNQLADAAPLVGPRSSYEIGVVQTCASGLCVYSAQAYGNGLTVLRLSYDSVMLEPKDDTNYVLIRSATGTPSQEQLTADLGEGEIRAVTGLGADWYFVDYNHYCC